MSDTMLGGLVGSEEADILNRFDSLSYEEGDLIVREGEDSEGVFLVLRGSVSVLRLVTNSEEVAVGMIYPGEAFGEIGLFGTRRRISTIRAEEPTSVIMLTRQEFFKLRQNRPDVALKLLEKLFCQVADRFEKIQNEWLSDGFPCRRGKREGEPVG